MPTGIYPRTEYHRKRISETNAKFWLGKRRPESGKHHSQIMKEKWSNPESRKVYLIGRQKTLPRTTGKHWKLSEETKERYSKIVKGRSAIPPLHKGKDCHLWRGGVSFLTYTIDWTSTLRRSIRERDNYICQSCGALQGDKAFDVHHIDYDKKNCNPNNLITLCRKCHVKTTFGDRNKWIEFFKHKCSKVAEKAK